MSALPLDPKTARILNGDSLESPDLRPRILDDWRRARTPPIVPEVPLPRHVPAPKVRGLPSGMNEGVSAGASKPALRDDALRNSKAGSLVEVAQAGAGGVHVDDVSQGGVASGTPEPSSRKRTKSQQFDSSTVEKQIQTLGADGDVLHHKQGLQLGAGVDVPGIPGGGVALTGACSADVTCTVDPVSKSPVYNVKISGEAIGEVSGKGRVGPAGVEGKLEVKGSVSMNYQFDSPAKAAEFLASIQRNPSELGAIEHLMALQSVELKEGIQAEISARLGVPYAGLKAAVGADAALGLRIERNPPAVVATASGKLSVEKQVELGLAVRAKEDISLSMEAKFPLRMGTAWDQITSGEFNPATCLDFGACSGSARLEKSSTASAGAGRWRLESGVSSVAISRKLSTREIGELSQHAASNDYRGAFGVIFGEEARWGYVREKIVRVGPDGALVSRRANAHGKLVFEGWREDHQIRTRREYGSGEVARAFALGE